MFPSNSNTSLKSQSIRFEATLLHPYCHLAAAALCHLRRNQLMEIIQEFRLSTVHISIQSGVRISTVAKNMWKY